jgi:DNA (cytosine-5)-methyltransferase 1
VNVGSLFSGIGGIDLGLERAGHRIVFQCEADEWRRGLLAARFPGVPCFEDVRAIRFEPEARGSADEPRAIGDAAGRPDTIPVCPDLLCGGFPCQDLSVAGQRRGFAGERSSLFFEFARIAGDVVPDGGWLLLENVPGLLSSHRGRDFAVLLATLADLGFHDLAWRVLDSQYFGVPQRRRRVFILARRASGGRAAEVLLEPESGGGDFAPGEGARSDAPRASLSGLGSGVPDDNDGQAGRLVAAPLSHGSNPNSNAAGRRREDDVNLVTGPLGGGNDGRGRRSEDDPNLVTHALTAAGHDASEDGTGRGTPIIAAPLVARQAKGGFTDPENDNIHALSSGVRRLTPTECERLQGFPDGWTKLDAKTPDSRRYAALGDAVTVPVAEWIGRRLMESQERRRFWPDRVVR